MIMSVQLLHSKFFFLSFFIPFKIQNHLQVAVDVFVKRKLSSSSTEKVSSKLFTVEPGGAQNVPLQVAYKEEIFVKPSDTK